MKIKLYLKFIFAYLCFGILSFVAVSTLISSLTTNHMIKSNTEAMYREANSIASGRLGPVLPGGLLLSAGYLQQSESAGFL